MCGPPSGICRRRNWTGSAPCTADCATPCPGGTDKLHPELRFYLSCHPAVRWDGRGAGSRAVLYQSDQKAALFRAYRRYGAGGGRERDLSLLAAAGRRGGSRLGLRPEIPDRRPSAGIRLQTGGGPSTGIRSGGAPPASAPERIGAGKGPVYGQSRRQLCRTAWSRFCIIWAAGST